MTTPPAINLEFLPDWARTPASTAPTFSESKDSGRPPRDRERRPERSDRSGRPARGNDRQGRGRDRKSGSPRREAPRPPPAPLAIDIHFLPESKALESVIDQVRASARAYPLFSIARMFLEKPERHEVSFELKDTPHAPTTLFQCTHCQTLALEKSAIVQHVLGQHRDLYYKEERQQGEPLKGNFTSVARCSLNGALIAPSNHHSYQTRLAQLYKTSFSKMSFERFRESIIQVRDPEIVKKWMEESAWKSQFTPLQDSESKPLASEGEMERHFLEKHAATATRQERSCTVPGETSRNLHQPALDSALRQTWETESRFPAKIAHKLREQFFKHGLHVFKGRKGMQFVTIVRPKAMTTDPSLISPGLKAILDHLTAHPQSTRKSLLETLAPEKSETGPVPPEQKSAVLQDLHWLIRQGHLVEYNNGSLELPRPPKKKVELENPSEEKKVEAPLSEPSNETAESTPETPTSEL